MKKYLGYVMIVTAFVGGYFYWHPAIIPGLALAATFMFTSARRNLAKGGLSAGPTNKILDAAFLFVLQCLIMFFVYNMGLFIVDSIKK